MTTSPSAITICRPESADKLADLEPLFAEIFGPRDRPKGWFRRKLRREVVDPAVSRIARSARGELLGAVLVGNPPSLPKTAQIALLGVLKAFQGRGCGTQLLRAAISAARSRGLQHLTVLAEPQRVHFYETAGFQANLSQTTLVATTPDRAQKPPMPVLKLPPAPWKRPRTTAICGWFEEAWLRTPQAERQTIAIGSHNKPQAWAHLSIEGQARLCHRLLIDTRSPPENLPERALAACQALRQAFTSAGPLFLYGLPTVSRVTDTLLRAGWRCAQESVLMVHPLQPHASPDTGVGRRQGATARVIMAADRR
ncbi:MAG TPA: GNAT family N-acetyltransferase [Nannocystis exedens]|nr:GNAT family N-acetyltransferase [Nannocystis exedens]